jgi:hypothetical protein
MAPISYAFQGLSNRAPPEAPSLEQLAQFKEFGAAIRLTQTRATLFSGETLSVPTCVNEFWTTKQRAASSLHEISYRACFKPQLPRFFIQRLTTQGEVVHDPFMGRGTTILEAGAGRSSWKKRSFPAAPKPAWSRCSC